VLDEPIPFGVMLVSVPRLSGEDGHPNLVRGCLPAAVDRIDDRAKPQRMMKILVEGVVWSAEIKSIGRHLQLMMGMIAAMRGPSL